MKRKTLFSISPHEPSIVELKKNAIRTTTKTGRSIDYLY